MAEALALWQGLNQALLHGAQKATIVGDSRMIIHCINTMNLPASMRLRQVLRRIALLMNVRRIWHVSNEARVLRQLYRMAFTLGCDALSILEDISFPTSFHHFLLPSARLFSARVMTPSPRLMKIHTSIRTGDQDVLRRKIFSPLIYHLNVTRCGVWLSSAQLSLHANVTGFFKATSSYDNMLVHDPQEFAYLGNTNRYSMSGTILGNGAIRKRMKDSAACDDLWAIMPNLFHGIDISNINGNPPRTGSKRNTTPSIKEFSTGRRKLSHHFVKLPLCYPDSIWYLLRIMAESGDSAASSPDPLLELEAEIRVLRRRVRRQGEFMNRMDAQGGSRLDRLDEEIGSTREEFAVALETLEMKVTAAIENMDQRLQNLEIAMENLRGSEKPGPSKNPTTAKSSAGARYR